MKTSDETVEETVVVFRRWRDKAGDVIALFPDETADNLGHCSSFEHVGQHGAANYQLVMAATSPASPEQYADLKSELESEPYNYRLRVLRRRPAHRGGRWSRRRAASA